MDYQQLLAYFHTNQPALLNLIRQLVTQETPSSDKPRLDAFAAFLADRLQAAGATVEVIANAERGNHVRATFTTPNTNFTAKPALVLCHFDTVWPVGSLVTHPFRIEDGKAYGPGIFDMQSSLALAEYVLHAVRDLNLTLPRPLTLLMTSDEETGSLTSQTLITEEAQKAAYALVMESPLPGGVLKTTRKGIGGFDLTVTGRAVHAGIEPEKGISAIQELAHQILKLHSFNDFAKGTTVNVGVIQGGTVSNVVAAHANAQIDVRAWTQDEADRLEQKILGLQPVSPDAQVQLSGGWHRPPLERKVTGALFERAQTIGKKLGLALQEGGTGGGSDGNLTGALGVPTLDGLGVPGAGAHADHEHIEVDQIAGRAALLVALLLEL
ncbi:MAG: M20 family metallopeptidase [Chloroflexota bacterium]|nr:M20 family metallopeptidase [Chloroflexota bacterium]